MIMAAWKLGPALAAGNSVVLKPSEKSPFTALRLAELALEAGLPPGVFNVVPGYGHEAGEALALHMDVDAIGFTGSTRTGRRMLDYAGRSNLKRVYNELGGKSRLRVSTTSPTWQARRQPRWPAACSSTRAKAATRPRACWCTKASPTASSSIVAAGPAVAAGRPAGRRHRDGRAGRRDPAAHRAGLHRRRPSPRAPAAWPAASGARRERRLLRRAHRV
jgi:hypothetical protein